MWPLWNSKDVARHIEANECCNICGKIASVWKNLLQQRNRSQKRTEYAYESMTTTTFKKPLMKHIKNKHWKKRPKIDK